MLKIASFVVVCLCPRARSARGFRAVDFCHGLTLVVVLVISVVLVLVSPDLYLAGRSVFVSLLLSISRIVVMLGVVMFPMMPVWALLPSCVEAVTERSA